MRSQVLESAEPGSYPPERFLCECVCCSPVPAPAWRGLHLPSFPSLQLGQPDMVCLRSPVSCHGDLVRCHLWMWAWWFPTGLDTQAQRIFSAQHSLLEQERKKKRWEKAEKDTGRWKDSSLQRPYPVVTLVFTIGWQEMGDQKELFLYLLNGRIRFQKLRVHSKQAKFTWHRYYNNNKLLVIATKNLNTSTKWQMSFL